MVYKDIEKQKKYQKEWAKKNKDKINKARNERRKKYGRKIYKKKKINHCLNCGNLCFNKYCSQKCQQEFKYNQYIEKWLNHKESGIRKTYNKLGSVYYIPVRKIYKFMRINYPQCQRCGWKSIHLNTNKTTLEIHHKDGNRENGYLENLEHLCPNCHSLTPFFVGRKI